MIQMELRLPYVPEKCIAFKFDRKNFEVVYVHHDNITFINRLKNVPKKRQLNITYIIGWNFQPVLFIDKRGISWKYL